MRRPWMRYTGKNTPCVRKITPWRREKMEYWSKKDWSNGVLGKDRRQTVRLETIRLLVKDKKIDFSSGILSYQSLSSVSIP